MTQQSWRLVIVVHQPIPSSSQQSSGLRQRNSDTSQPQNPNSQNYLSLLVTPEDASTNNLAFTQKQPLTSNIPPAIITEDKLLATIFPFEFEETATMPLFSGAVLEAKPITMMYIDTKVEGHQINPRQCARIITADRATKTLISEIDNFPFEVNGIVTPIKVLVMEATQYQALIGNDWLFKVNATLDWNTQELQLTYQDQHICRETIDRTGGGEKKAYQVSWADKEHNKLLPILFWDDSNKGKGKQKEELI
ncbi:hypothetical protein G9A89_022878 [Geosiphon pyriformis]|nr:hypothetical protein G9A89_022878 [Geosiphon pyriformis]